MKTIGLVPALLIWTIPLVIGVIGLVALPRISRSAERMSSALELIAAAVRDRR